MLCLESDPVKTYTLIVIKFGLVAPQKCQILTTQALPFHVAIDSKLLRRRCQ